ncbi:MAG TPA: hypothetical protein VF691_18655 [Cytophagaceae bacterium]|jgi:hypothetical protein
MKKFIALSITTICALLFNFRLFAQDSLQVQCDCSRPDYHAPIGVMIDHGHAKGELMVSYRYMRMSMNGNLRDKSRISEEKIQEQYLMSSNKMTMQMHMLMVMYGLSDRLTIMGMGEFDLKRMDMSMPMDAVESPQHDHSQHSHAHESETTEEGGLMHDHTHSRGFGDTKVYLLYSLISSFRHQLLLSGGVNIPTGATNLGGESLMGTIDRYSYSMQMGSGSWGALPGVTYTGNSDLNSWGLQLQADLKMNRNAAGYRVGNGYTNNIWVARKWTSWMSNSLRISTEAIGKMEGIDNEIELQKIMDPDANIVNKGGLFSTINLGVNFYIPGGLLEGNRIGLEFGLPVYQQVNGIQMRRQTFINAGWQYMF